MKINVQAKALVMSDHPSSLENLLNQSLSGLAELSRKASKLSALQQSYQQQVPAHLANHSRVANLRQGVLVIEVASAAWLSQLRMQRSALLSQMRQIDPSLTSLDLRINPGLVKAVVNPQVQRPNKREISSRTAEQLRALAETTDGKLSESLKKLAALSERRQNNK
ncbi:DUF721 domain-containing protein [Gallaecimonas pentaromativorans]|uniref:DUF721 domain-containing protein n=2 Tax=Gallaecimonas pentaromativorans TaxID=584787 RepID=A0A3N1PQI0_9GAMM|nr:DciA family protein [Gallaecimonas pentaromativorans]MED5523573.1 DciA family protein [Pseudomonadota bacterium]ROQ30763.1 hypothetical protein EDC28_101455 [Gallaecimonas pentaromativorans]